MSTTSNRCAFGGWVILTLTCGADACAQLYPGQRQPTGVAPYATVLGDWNGDGHVDALTANQGIPVANVLYSDATEPFLRLVPLLTTSSSPVPTSTPAAVTGEWNGDGIDDAAVAVPFELVPGVPGHRVWVFLGAAGSPLTPLPALTLDPAPTSLAAVDLNGDGLDELIVATVAGLRVYAAAGGGAFGAPTAPYAAGAVSDVSACDWNGDGLVDLALAASVNVVLLTGNGDATFDPPLTTVIQVPIFGSNGGPTTVNIGLRAITAGDFDGDGDADLATNTFHALQYGGGGDPGGIVGFTTYECSQGAAVLLGDGSGGIDVKTDSVLATGGLNFTTLDDGSLVTMDIAGDGDDDLVAIGFEPFPSGLLRLVTVDAAGEATTVRTLAAGSAPAALASADVNHDQRTDLVVCNAGSSDLSVFLATLEGRIGPPSPTVGISSTGYYRPADVASGDVNGDGVSDVAAVSSDDSSTTNGGDSKISIMVANGLGGFALAKEVASPASPSLVKLADFDGDGGNDLLTDGFYGPGGRTPGLFLFVGDVAGSFELATLVASQGTPISLEVVDVNLDGALDLVTTRIAEDQTGCVFIGDGFGGFSSATTFAHGSGVVALMAAGDLDGDAHVDLALADTGDGQFPSGVLTLASGDGSGGFAPYETTAIPGSHYRSIAVGDMTADGTRDLVVTLRLQPYFWSHVATIALDADGRFGTYEVVVIPFESSSIALADVNMDGRLDVAAAAGDFNAAAVFLNLGDGVLDAPRLYATDFSTTKIHASEMGGNGQPDLVAANFWGMSISVLQR